MAKIMCIMQHIKVVNMKKIFERVVDQLQL